MLAQFRWIGIWRVECEGYRVINLGLNFVADFVYLIFVDCSSEHFTDSGHRIALTPFCQFVLSLHAYIHVPRGPNVTSPAVSATFQQRRAQALARAIHSS